MGGQFFESGRRVEGRSYKPIAVLTSEQSQAIASAQGEQIHLIDPDTKQDYVLVKADVFERLQRMLLDETVYTSAEMVDHMMADDDADDPQLADLQKKYGGVQK